MDCCKAEELEWCKDEPVVEYTDRAGRGYCVFHAPLGRKDITLEEFNELILTAINAAIKNKESSDLRATVFEGDISFNQYGEDNPIPEITFTDAVFNGEVDFRRATFSSEAIFENAQFKKETSFDFVRFNGDVNFKEVKFTEDSSFKNTKFDDSATFDNTQFTKEVSFRRAQFTGKTSFNMTKFSDKASFQQTKFSEKANFTLAQFNRGARFIFTEFNGLVDFSGAQLNGEVYFTDSKFSNHGLLRGITIRNRVYLENLDLTRVSFMDSDLRKIDFINCTWNKTNKYGRNILYDEIELLESEPRFSFDRGRFVKVATLYRRLKQKYKDEHNEPEVSEWHYGEREMYRKGSLFRRYFPLSLSNLYWLSSGYGESVARSGGALVFGIIILSILSGFVGLTSVDEAGIHGITRIKGLSGIMDLNNIWMLLVNTFHYAIFKATYFKPSSIGGEFLKLFTQMVVPIQIALFALTVRNRFRR